MSSIADKLAKKMSGRLGKQVRLNLVYLNLGSSVTVSFLSGVVLGVLTMIITLVAWSVLSRTGAFVQLDTLVSGTTVSDKAINTNAFFGFSRAIGLSAILGLVTVVVVTVFGTVATVVYNLIVKFTGGLFVGFTDD